MVQRGLNIQAIIVNHSSYLSFPQTVERRRLPPLLEHRLHAAAVGRAIYARLAAPPVRKRMIILPNSRHGTEGADITVMQQEIRRFIDSVL